MPDVTVILYPCKGFKQRTSSKSQCVHILQLGHHQKLVFKQILEN
jgi:hypothetical protein